MQVSVTYLVLTILVALLSSQVSAKVSRCNATIIDSMSSLHPGGKPTEIIKNLKGAGKYYYAFVSSGDETKKEPICLGFEVISDHVGEMFYTLADSTTISKEFPIAEGNCGEGYIVLTNGAQEYEIYVLYSKKHVVCTYRCCKKCTGTKPNVGCAVAHSHKDEPGTEAALKEGLEVLKARGLADDLVFLGHCSK